MVAAPTKMPSRSKPDKALKTALQADVHRTRMVQGTVTAVRWDGTVNLLAGGVRYIGVTCTASYVNRQSGDRVQVVIANATPLVLGVLGGDSLAAAPEVWPTNVMQFTWGYGNTAGQNRPVYWSEAGDTRIGRPGSVRLTYPGDTYFQAAFSFWDGTQNLMNGPADLVQSIDLFVARDVWDEGDDGPAHLQLVPHKMDALPASPQSMLYQQTLDPPSIDFTLEAGEQQLITLPDNWRDSIGATTLDSNSIRGFSVWPGNNGVEPWALDNSYALLTNLTCAIRIYPQT
jgi:hypothetical protein